MSTTSAAPAAASAVPFLTAIAPIINYGLLDTLTPDPESDANFPNRTMRQVKSGHYVAVTPTPLANPIYVAHSAAMVEDGFGGLVTDDMAKQPDFVRFFAGDIASAATKNHGWATGYALSIMGQEYVQQDPTRTGNAYGDGRAISILEVAVPSLPPRHWEFQLKGAGPTPYCRGADGRAVLRSSIREFLCSEAMHRLSVPTTRTLVLVASTTEFVRRPWYSEGNHSDDPDRLITEPCAISTRVAPSFIRIGQLELFGRRARKKEHSRAFDELILILSHAIVREYPEILVETTLKNANDVRDLYERDPLQFLDLLVAFGAAFRQRLIAMIAHWIRVGFCQGNFNADNCSVGGRTIDYGPFGFMQVADLHYQPWAGGGEHYAFINQTVAALANFKMFCVALMPVFHAADEAGVSGASDKFKQIDEVLKGFAVASTEAVQQTFAAKFGLKVPDAELFAQWKRLTESVDLDYTIFFRELSSFPTTCTQASSLRKALYCNDAEVDVTNAPPVNEWLALWHRALTAQHGDNFLRDAERRDAVRRSMNLVNPKFVPREGMLADAYRLATDARDYALVRELQQVFDDPYDTRLSAMDPVTAKRFEDLYYRRASRENLVRGGIAVMT